MKSFAIDLSNTVIMDFFNQEENEKGKREITFDQMLDMMTMSQKDETEKELMEVFALFDIDGKGYVDLETLKRVVDLMGEYAEERDLEEMISKADRSGTGKVYFEDFYYLIKYVE